MRACSPELPNRRTRDAARDNNGGSRRCTRIHRQGGWRQGARRKLPFDGIGGIGKRTETSGLPKGSREQLGGEEGVCARR
jgi:hypothetical protein